MQITRNSLETAAGPADWFTGDVYIDTVATAAEPSRLAAASVHFTPGARTAWHTHPLGQTIYVTEGLGRCQRRGGGIEVIHRATACTSSPARTIGTALRPTAS
jgi:quercetin dioxygenase-like cupin family protein